MVDYNCGIEFESISLWSITQDQEYTKTLKEQEAEENVQVQEKVNEKKEDNIPKTVSNTSDTQVPTANALDMKKIGALIIVIILAIIGYFMK